MPKFWPVPSLYSVRGAVRELWPDWMETQTQLSELSLLDDSINTKITFTVEPVLSGHSKLIFGLLFEWPLKTSFTVTLLASSNFCCLLQLLLLSADNIYKQFGPR